MAPIKPLEGDAFRDNSNTGPRASHGIPQGGLFSVYAEADINAPTHVIYDTLLAVKQYKEWSSFIIDVQITKHPHAHDPALKMEQGTFMTFTCQVVPEEKTLNREVCQYLEKLKTKDDGHLSHAKSNNVTRIRLNLDNANLFTPSWLYKSEWTHEIHEKGDGTTHYRTWAVYGGLGAKTVRKKFADPLKGKFQGWAMDLKKRCEEGPSKQKDVGLHSKMPTSNVTSSAGVQSKVV